MSRMTGRVGVLLAALVGATSAFAQDAPENFLNRQLTIVIPYGPGGLTDARGRAFQAHMEDVIDVPVVVQNLSGGGALVGTNFVYSRPSDGTHVLIASGSDGPHAHSVLSPTELGWSWEDWTPIGQFAMSILGFVVSEDSQFETLMDAVEQVRKEPGSVTLASLGPGRADDLYMLEFMQATDTIGKWNWVFYSSSAAAQADILSGDLDMAYIGVSRKDMIDHPNFEVLAQGIKPSEIPDDWPFDWPTVEDAIGTELDLVGASYATVFAKTDTPEERLDYLEYAFETVANDEGFRKARDDYGEPALWRDRETAQDNLDAVHTKLQEMKPLRDEHVKQ
ncbi:tripartite tricarboxylate transporter substrate binding protein [Acuticoccus sp. M5D2P5]|uniref:Bug family tripartite tricarboxylate transporter substrate binding protein n=1 Tax=Acuticoccus kalidii TaxID=2910977 RepID=UPI001F3A0CF4|nr:tripartite tricarboxylate transporter substrate binding protein [Acuticoccus kalidii]MCF3935333.1 tripartite tricarboxylate transporter substrate binding protein [Acuticoccus kalidii]